MDWKGLRGEEKQAGDEPAMQSLTADDRVGLGAGGRRQRALGHGGND